MNWQEMQSASEDDPRNVATRRRDALVHTLGNLTLLTRPLNSAVSNGPWSDKRAQILKYSLLPINRHLDAAETWDEETILARGRELFDYAHAIWSRPKGRA